VNKDMREENAKLENEVESALSQQELIEAAVGSTLQQTSRLEAKVRVLEEEKAKLARKIANYEEANQNFCGGFGTMFGLDTMEVSSLFASPKSSSSSDRQTSSGFLF
jgi:vacuolar-type H+-ATPase subunit I/STV1